MLLLWHEALGSDDEQAAEDELCARVLYAWGDAGGARLLQRLHLAQGLLAFARTLRRGEEREEAARTPEWASVTLSSSRLFVLEVEPQIFLALTVQPTVDIKDHGPGYKALLREIYGMFRLFHGSIDCNLRRLPAPLRQRTAGDRADQPEAADKATASLQSRMYADGMELLMDIAATRRRLRKLRLTIDSRAHNQRLDVSDDDETQDNVMMQLQEDQREVEAELEVLLAQSPAAKLQSKCAEFFPTLLQGLDVCGTSGLSELQGLGYFPMDQPTFLALQTFVNGFRTELKLSGESAGEDKVESLALFFKGNLLWSSMETTTMPLLYKFLRLREERGMTMLRDDYNRDEDCDEPYPDKTLADGSNPQLWMVNAYNDTFLPIWSSKLSYAECDAVTQSQDGPPHARRAARSLHKQHPVSLSTFLSEAPPSSSGGNMMTPISAPRSTAAAESSPFGSPSHSPASSGRIAPPRSNGASPATSESAIKARARSIAFRNAGLLLKNGCFSKLQLASRMKLPENAQDEVQAVWSPFVFPFDDEVAFGGELPPAAIEPTTANDRVVVWHEADLTMLIHLRTKATELDPNNSASDSLNVATLERLERYLDGQQRFQNLAELILSRYNATFAPEKNVPNIHPLPPFLYINRVNLAFRMQHVPRLLKGKEDDLFPIPAKLLAHYFPAFTMALLNDLHAELHRSSSGGNREICVRTRHAGWVLAKKSETSSRELYVFFDSKVSSVYDLSDSLQMLLLDQFGNVLF